MVVSGDILHLDTILIIFRYLTKQIFQVMLAVTLVLLVVSLTSRFIQYLGDAVAGELASDVLLLLMVYRLPDFLLLILPLSLFLGVLLVYGRMYAENEMAVLISSGVSQVRLLRLTLLSSALVMVLVSLISFQMAPWGVRNAERLMQNQSQLTEVDLIVAGQFQSFGDGGRVTYAERTGLTSDQDRRLENVFVALSSVDPAAEESVEENAEENAQAQASQTDQSLRIIISESARPEFDVETGSRFMRLENVYEYEGVPGSNNYTVGHFDVQSILLPEPDEFEPVLEEKALATSELLLSSLPEHQAELQWRVSVVLMIPIITFIAVPLSKVAPRQGQYTKLLPAALIFALYYILLTFSVDLLADGNLPAIVGLAWVHVLFFIVGLLLFRRGRLKQAPR